MTTLVSPFPLRHPFLSGGGRLGELIAAFDWQSTCLGDIDYWPQSLKSTVGLLVHSPTAICLLWGAGRWPHLRILFTTGYTRNAVVNNGVLDAGVSVLPKPFALAALAAKVREVLDSTP